MSINNNCSSVRYYAWRLRSAILLALEMMNEWSPTFFFKYFYAGIVQSNLCWKIHNKYVFHVNIHIFVLKYLVQINYLCSENFYKFENILPGMRRKVNISTLMVFRNQRRRKTNNSKSIKKFPKEVNGTATKCRVYTVHEKLKMTVFVLLKWK